MIILARMPPWLWVGDSAVVMVGLNEDPIVEIEGETVRSELEDTLGESEDDNWVELGPKAEALNAAKLREELTTGLAGVFADGLAGAVDKEITFDVANDDEEEAPIPLAGRLSALIMSAAFERNQQ